MKPARQKKEIEKTEERYIITPLKRFSWGRKEKKIIQKECTLTPAISFRAEEKTFEG